MIRHFCDACEKEVEGVAPWQLTHHSRPDSFLRPPDRTYETCSLQCAVDLLTRISQPKSTVVIRKV